MGGERAGQQHLFDNALNYLKPAIRVYQEDSIARENLFQLVLNFARACITFSYLECFTYSFRQFTFARSIMYTLVIDKNNLAR